MVNPLPGSGLAMPVPRPTGQAAAAAAAWPCVIPLPDRAGARGTRS
jgi:hypothetical protein